MSSHLPHSCCNQLTVHNRRVPHFLNVAVWQKCSSQQSNFWSLWKWQNTNIILSNVFALLPNWFSKGEKRKFFIWLFSVFSTWGCAHIWNQFTAHCSDWSAHFLVEDQYQIYVLHINSSLLCRSFLLFSLIFPFLLTFVFPTPDSACPSSVGQKRAPQSTHTRNPPQPFQTKSRWIPHLFCYEVQHSASCN